MKDSHLRLLESPAEQLMCDLRTLLSDQAEIWYQHALGLRELADDAPLRQGVYYNETWLRAKAEAFEACAGQLGKIAMKLGDD